MTLIDGMPPQLGDYPAPVPSTQAQLENYVSADDLVVPVETDIFKERPDAPYWIGIVAAPGGVVAPAEYEAIRRFRANVYIDDKGFLEASARCSDGGEVDAYDNRAVHYGVFENRGSGLAAVVGAGRLILKREGDGPLPVEAEFPEAFPEPLPVGSTEGSRYIARHPDKQQQRAISHAGIRMLMTGAAVVGAPNMHAIVERGLAAYFRSLRMPYDMMASLKYIEDYKTRNMAIRFNPNEVIALFQHPEMEGQELAPFFHPDHLGVGLGYYDKSLQKRLELV